MSFIAPAPATDIYLCNVPWDSSYRHVSDGATAAWILATVVRALSDYKYQRRDNVIHAGCRYDEAMAANYVAYRNVLHENRWIYAFIDRIEYINEGTTDIYIRTDVYQTWRQYMTFLPSYTVREHVLVDTIGANTIPEGLETGEYINGSANHAGLHDACVVVASLKALSDGADAIGSYQCGIYTGVYYYAYPVHPTTGTDADALTQLRATIAAIIGREGGFDNILAVFMCPRILIADSWGTAGPILSGSATNPLPSSYSARSITHTAPARPVMFGGYTPKNNKLYCYPYCFLNAYNNTGATALYKYEHFNGTPVFQIIGGIGPDPVVKLVPTNKLTGDSSQDNTEESIVISGWPLVMWSGNAWASYMAAHPGAAAQGIAGTAMAVMGIVSGGVVGAGAMISGANAVLGSAAAMVDRMVAPPITGGHVASAPANIAGDMMDVYFSERHVRYEYAQSIDDFFTMFGYKVNRLKLPNLTGRPYWNYVQTIDAAIKGPIPDGDRKELEAIFNRGVTIWHDPSRIGNYVLDNGVS